MSADDTLFERLGQLQLAQRQYGRSGDLLYDISTGFQRAVLNRAAPGQGSSLGLLFGGGGDDESNPPRLLGNVQVREGDLDCAAIDSGFARVREKLAEAQALYSALLDDVEHQLSREGGIVYRWRATFARQLRDGDATTEVASGASADVVAAPASGRKRMRAEKESPASSKS